MTMPLIHKRKRKLNSISQTTNKVNRKMPSSLFEQTRQNELNEVMDRVLQNAIPTVKGNFQQKRRQVVNPQLRTPPNEIQGVLERHRRT